MTPFEQELKKALARREPSADFSGRLFARLKEEAAQQAAPRLSWWRRVLSSQSSMAPALAIVCTLLLVVSGTLIYEQHQRDVQGERAKQQLLVALRITGEKLHATQRQVQQVSQRDNPRRLL